MKIVIKLTSPSLVRVQKLKQIPAKYKTAIQSTFRQSGLILRKTTQYLMDNTPKTGRAYIIKGRVHIASSPGNAPANLTKALRRSIGFSPEGTSLDFGYKKNYGRYLELGTKKMAKRPALRLAIDKNINRIQDDIGKSIEKLF